MLRCSTDLSIYSPYEIKNFMNSESDTRQSLPSFESVFGLVVRPSKPKESKSHGAEHASLVGQQHATTHHEGEHRGRWY